MNEQVKAIEIVFENLDYARIPVKHIGLVCLDRITVSISRGACNAVLKHFEMETAYLQIMNSYKCNWEKPDENTAIYEEFEKRISENDIAYFRIHYMNDTCEDIYVPWEDCEDIEYRNRLQHVTQDKDRNFIIEIGQGGK